MTPDQLATLRPGDLAHFMPHSNTSYVPECVAWEVDQTRVTGSIRDSAVPVVMVTFRQKWPGGGAPILMADAPLTGWHRAQDCPHHVRAAS